MEENKCISYLSVVRSLRHHCSLSWNPLELRLGAQATRKQPNKNFVQFFWEDLRGKSHSLGGLKGVRFVFDILYSLKAKMFAAKLMVGRLFSFWEGLFSGAMLVSGRVYLT